VSDLPTGHYDVKIGGDVYTTFHFTNTNKPDQLWNLFIPGSFAADFDEDSDYPVWFPGVAGKIIRLDMTIQQVSVASSATVYILGITSPSSNEMTFPGNSKWNAGISPGTDSHRWRYGADLDITVADDEAFCIGWDYSAGIFSGLTLTLRFRPS